ncbi:MAG: Glucosyl-3-phosphoglycerate phosphatase [Planctomycetota bacterium]|jgi:broad specificity phosphatase PhoE
MKINVQAPAIPHDVARGRPDPQAATGTNSTLWLVRHAEVHADWRGRAYGGLDVPLAPEGEEETRVFGARFSERAAKPALVRSSHLARARAMGESIARSCGSILVVDERLREVSRGDWQGLPSVEFKARWEAQADLFRADPWNWKGHGGESDADIWARAWPAVAETLLATGGATCVVAAHYNVIRVLATRLLGLPAHESFLFRTDTACATVILDDPRGFRLLAQNVADPREVG